MAKSHHQKVLDYLCVGGAVVVVVGLISAFLHGNYLFFMYTDKILLTPVEVFSVLVACTVWMGASILGPVAVIINFKDSYKRIKEYRAEAKRAKAARFPDHEFGLGNKPKKSSHAPTTF